MNLVGSVIQKNLKSMCVYLYVRLRARVSVCVCVCVCLRVHVCMCACLYACVSVCVRVCMCACLYACMWYGVVSDNATGVEGICIHACTDQCMPIRTWMRMCLLQYCAMDLSFYVFVPVAVPGFVTV